MSDPVGRLKEIRKELDEAITYGWHDAVTRLIGEGLTISREFELLGDLEYFKAQELIAAEDYSNALLHLDKAIEFNPLDACALNDRALSMVELGIIDGALEYFDKGITAGPQYATAYHNKGWLLNKIGRYREAIDCFRQALSLEPERPVTYENLGDAYVNLGEYKSALDAFKQAIALLKSVPPDIKQQLLLRIAQIDKILEDE